MAKSFLVCPQTKKAWPEATRAFAVAGGKKIGRTILSGCFYRGWNPLYCESMLHPLAICSCS